MPEEPGTRFSFRALREDEKALDQRASLADLETDIDYRRTLRVIGRSVLFVRYVWLRYVISFSSHWLRGSLAIVLVPWVGKILIDHVVLGQPVSDVTGYPSFLIPAVEMLEGASAGGILFWVALFSVVGLVAGLAHWYVMALFDARLTQSVVHLVRCRLFGSVQALPMTKLDDQPIGDSVYRVVNDTGVIPDIIGTVVREPVVAVSAFVVALVTLLSAYPDSPAVGVFAVGALPMYVLVVVPFSRMLRRRSQAVMAAQSAFTSNIEEGMDNMLAVQALGAKETERERFRQDSAESFKRIRFSGLAFDVVGTFVEIATQILLWGFTVYVVARVVFGDFSPGDFVVVLGYFAAMREPAEGLAKIWMGLQGDAAKARRVFAMLDEPPETETGRLALPLIEEDVSFRGAGFVYPDGRRALEDVTFNAPMGQILAIVGPTGAGKTTLAYLIPRYHVASEGHVLIDGQDVNDVTLESLRGQTSYVFQETHTVNESILENTVWANPMQPGKRWSELRGQRGFTISSSRCPTATTPSSEHPQANCRWDRSSGSGLPAAS